MSDSADARLMDGKDLADSRKQQWDTVEQGYDPDEAEAFRALAAMTKAFTDAHALRALPAQTEAFTEPEARDSLLETRH